MDNGINPYEAPSGDIEATVIAEIVEEPESPRRPWGFWATVGLSATVMMVFLVAQTVVYIPFAIQEFSRNPRGNPAEMSAHLEANGLLLALATITSTTFCVPLVLLFARLRRQMPLGEYLGLRPISWGSLAKWLALSALFVLSIDGLTFLLSRDVVPSSMIEAYQTAGFVPLLWIALVCAAPLFEETFFRSFLLQGFRYSWLGSVGAIVITSFLWAIIHLQYDLYQISIIFFGGLLLGTARLKTGSVYVVIAMHALWNMIATVETAWVVAG